MSVPSPIGRRETVVALLILTSVTGLVDAVSYLKLGHVFVANMTGNVVFLGFSVDPRSGLSPVSSLIAIAGFVAGAIAGGRLIARLAVHPRAWLTVAFGIEALLLALVALLTAIRVLPFAGPASYLTIVVLAIALGVQNSTVRHFGVPDLTTTVLSLTLTGLSADSKVAGGPGSKAPRRLGSILCMLAGAAAGAGLVTVSPSVAIGLAAALTALSAVMFFTGEEIAARFSAGSARSTATQAP